MQLRSCWRLHCFECRTRADDTLSIEGARVVYVDEMRSNKEAGETATDISVGISVFTGPFRFKGPSGRVQLQALFRISGSRPTAAARPEMSLISAYS